MVVGWLRNMRRHGLINVKQWDREVGSAMLAGVRVQLMASRPPNGREC